MSDFIMYDGRKICRRPKKTDEFVLEDVFEAILPDLAAECSLNSAVEIAAAKKEFIDAARSADDGYEIMRNLERDAFWSGNFRIVEIFENAPFLECLSTHVQRWIDYFKVEPLFQQGDMVAFRHGAEQLSGRIASVQSLSEPGRYTIHVDGRVGKPLVCWERCEKA